MGGRTFSIHVLSENNDAQKRRQALTVERLSLTCLKWATSRHLNEALFCCSPVDPGMEPG